MTHMNYIVLFDEVFSGLFKDVVPAKADIRRKPFCGWDLVETNI